MTHRLDVARGRDVVTRWCALAEQRLEHLTELFETGRWRRYHSETAFLENIQEAKNALETWRDLLAYENAPLDQRRAVPVRLRTVVARAPAEPVRSIASFVRTNQITSAEENFSAQVSNHQASTYQPLRVVETVSPSLASQDLDLPVSNTPDSSSEAFASHEAQDLDAQDLRSHSARTTPFDVAALTLDFEAMKNRYPLLRTAL